MSFWTGVIATLIAEFVVLVLFGVVAVLRDEKRGGHGK